MITDQEIIMVGLTTLEVLLERMQEHDLYRERDKHGYLCDCMMHYCLCEHEGFRQAYDFITAQMSDPHAKVAP